MRAKRKKLRIPADVLEFAEHPQRLERENILIHPDHPAPHQENKCQHPR